MLCGYGVGHNNSLSDSQSDRHQIGFRCRYILCISKTAKPSHAVFHVLRNRSYADRLTAVYRASSLPVSPLPLSSSSLCSSFPSSSESSAYLCSLPYTFPPASEAALVYSRSYPFSAPLLHHNYEIFSVFFCLVTRCVRACTDTSPLVVIYYRQHCAQRKAPVYKLLRGSFEASQGRHVAPMGEICHGGVQCTSTRFLTTAHFNNKGYSSFTKVCTKARVLKILYSSLFHQKAAINSKQK